QGRIGATSWCLTLFDHMSKSAAYATSSWQTCTVDRANVPTSTNTTVPGSARRNVVKRPTDKRLTIGQKTISKTVKTLRWLIRQFRRKNPETLTSSRWSDAPPTHSSLVADVAMPLTA